MTTCSCRIAIYGAPIEQVKGDTIRRWSSRLMLSVGEVTATIVVLFHTTEARREYRITPSSSFYFSGFASWALFSYTQTLFLFNVYELSIV